MNPKRYLCIGSTLGMFNLQNSVIFGGGGVNPNDVPVGMPSQIIAVRGPLTRKWLIDHGIPCPEVYGDTALLLPLYYQPP